MLKWQPSTSLSGKIDVFYKTKLIVIRIDAYGNLCDSKPCKECISVIKSFGIKKIYYSIAGGLLVENILKINNTHCSAAQRNLSNNGVFVVKMKTK